MLAFVVALSLNIADTLLLIGVFYDSPTLALINAVADFEPGGMPVDLLAGFLRASSTHEQQAFGAGRGWRRYRCVSLIHHGRRQCRLDVAAERDLSPALPARVGAGMMQMSALIAATIGIALSIAAHLGSLRIGAMLLTAYAASFAVGTAATIVASVMLRRNRRRTPLVRDHGASTVRSMVVHLPEPGAGFGIFSPTCSTFLA